MVLKTKGAAHQVRENQKGVCFPTSDILAFRIVRD
ncbi:hypothetical protein Prudu_005486 [Prunus dulcis]|uniref:Uncharacterized protein n=1 Tax=Prunus dulcis TaxID=3755 RepID=A0A4Y1QXQ0_PRUDU|nr:hypothetical protein Prudu_005486 [Prunus dulcis]